MNNKAEAGDRKQEIFQLILMMNLDLKRINEELKEKKMSPLWTKIQKARTSQSISLHHAMPIAIISMASCV